MTAVQKTAVKIVAFISSLPPLYYPIHYPAGSPLVLSPGQLPGLGAFTAFMCALLLVELKIGFQDGQSTSGINGDLPNSIGD
jgi:hypothetical protein